MPAPIPLLFLGDNPMLQGGLARIGRDLATLASRLPQFRVGYLGRGGTGTRQLPFVLYPYPELTGQWGEHYLPSVWRDFAGDERGIVFTIWDPSRLHWFSRPAGLPDGLRDFLTADHFDRWGYFPIDSTGPGDKLTTQVRDTLMGYQRVLAYTEWAGNLVRRTLGDTDAQERGVDWLPHGMNLSVFRPAERRQARGWCSLLHAHDIVMGVVATNQVRKDWGLVAMVTRLLRDRLGRRFKAWWHCDVSMRHWNLPALIADYGLYGTVILSVTQFTDAQMAQRYSACDFTVHPGSEGFGYPIAESLACGVPAVTMAYAGGGDLVKEHPEWLVQPSEFRLETLHNCMRPVFAPSDWADTACRLLDAKPSQDYCRAMVEHLDWSRLWVQWQKWWLGGLAI